MKYINIITSITILVLITSCETLKLADLGEWGAGGGLTTEKIIAGLKQALDMGTESAVNQLSQKGGFSNNKLYRIGMPKELVEVTDTMKKIGLGFMVTNFENRMNLAAEKASAQATPVFLDAIKQMTFSDAKKILNGPDTAATDYLKKTTFTKLTNLYQPIIKENMEKVGAVKYYNSLMAKYDAIPFKSKPRFSLDDYITKKALNAMFSELAKEETKIRTNPAARTTELLKQVFGH